MEAEWRLGGDSVETQLRLSEISVRTQWRLIGGLAETKMKTK